MSIASSGNSKKTSVAKVDRTRIQVAGRRVGARSWRGLHTSESLDIILNVQSYRKVLKQRTAIFYQIF